MDNQKTTILLIIGIILHISYTFFTMDSTYNSYRFYVAIGASVAPIVLSLLLMPISKLFIKNKGIFISAVAAIYLGIIIRIINSILYATHVFN